MTDPRDFQLRAVIARDGAPLARPVRKPDPPARPAYVPPPPAIHVRVCGEPGCAKPMSAIGDVYTCACGRVDRLVNRKHFPGAGLVGLWAVTRREEASK